MKIKIITRWFIRRYRYTEGTSMSTTTPAQTRRNRLIAIIGVALLGVSITLGPSGLLVARTTECVW